MSVLQRQKNNTPAKAFSARLPVDSYEALVEFAISRRLTLAMAVTYLIDKALDAEKKKQTL